ncbi:MAG: AzlC family ABC transporter permease [Halanaerobiales bacterium]
MEEFKNGIKAAIPIAIGYIPIALTFGLLAKSNEISFYITTLMSLLVFAGASQFVAVNLLALGTGTGEIILTTFILNFRHFLMSASLSQKMAENIDKKLLSLLAFGITDETFSIASLKKNELKPAFMLGLNLLSYLAWVVGTAAGHRGGAVLPDSLQSSMGIALYAMFIGLLVPSLKESSSETIVALITVIVSLIFYFLSKYISLSEGWRIIIVTIISAFIGALIYSDKGGRSRV